MRVAPLVVLLLSLTLAAPASAHDPGAGHSDSRVELAGTDVGATVATVEAAAGTEDEGLPATWCGTERTTDDTAHAAFPQLTQQFKVVYAYANDRTNRFAQWADALQANVSLIGRFMGAQSGGRKTLRFDMGTDCGPDYVDIQVVQLPGPQIKYASRDLSVLKADLETVVPAEYGERNVLVLADRLSSAPAGAWYGIGESYVTETDPTPHNNGGLYAALWVPDALNAPAATANGWWPEGMLHELTHNLGAVGESAPHATLYGHCYDGEDVMCYDDGGLPEALTSGCPLIPGVMNQVFDCGNDDYFNVAPAGGYLATHWNTFDSHYLASCADAAPACGGTTVPDSNPQLPVSTTPPLVTGDARVGAALSASTGGWANAPASYAYQWERGDGFTWSAAPGATGPTYALTGGDAGLRLRVRVIATNPDGSTAAYSPSTAPVADATAPDTTSPAAVPQSPSAPQRSVPNRGRAWLKVARGRGKGKRIGMIDFEITAGRLRAAPTRVKLARGRYRVRVCTTAATGCATRTLKVRRASIVRLPGLSLGVPTGSTGRVSYTLRATRGVFSALTAKRPSAGLLLGP